jgi:hypothetical protein
MPSGPRHYSPCRRSNSWWTQKQDLEPRLH